MRLFAAAGRSQHRSAMQRAAGRLHQGTRCRAATACAHMFAAFVASVASM